MVEQTPHNKSGFMVCCDPGEVIFTESSYGDEMYIIRSGKVEISRTTEHGKQILAVIEKGGFFGEMALLNDTPRTATVTAIEATTLLPLNKNSVVSKINSCYELYGKVPGSKGYDRVQTGGGARPRP